MTAPRSIPRARTPSINCNFTDPASPMSPSAESPSMGSIRSGSFESLWSPLRYVSSFPSRVMSDMSAPQSRRGSVSDSVSSGQSTGQLDPRALAAIFQSSSSFQAQNPMDRHKGMPSVEVFLGD